jgi:NADPH:quinone reductase-like Zn-dependent oxidoreductase
MRIRMKSKRHCVSYSFPLMKASGDQLREIGRLMDSGIIRAVVDRVFPFKSTNEAVAYLERGRAKGKVVVKVRWKNRLPSMFRPITAREVELWRSPA